MNLYFSTYFMAAVFGAIAFALFIKPAATEKFSISFLRSKTAAYLVFGAAIAWFLYILSQLGEADFGDIKYLLMAIFGGAGILAFKYLPDFLSVRGAAVISLLACRFFLDSAYMQEPPSRLVLVSISYIIILFSLYIGALPYRLRDILNWIFASSVRVKATATLAAILFVALVVSAFMY